MIFVDVEMCYKIPSLLLLLHGLNALIADSNCMNILLWQHAHAVRLFDAWPYKYNVWYNQYCQFFLSNLLLISALLNYSEHCF